MKEIEQLSLAYLAKSAKPLWGGHLERGEPISDPDMQRWLNLGFIKQIANEGYVITRAGRHSVERSLEEAIEALEEQKMEDAAKSDRAIEICRRRLMEVRASTNV